MHTEIYNKIKGLLWKPLHMDITIIDSDYEDYDDNMRLHNTILFDTREMKQNDREEYIEDLFDDGVPDGLDLDKTIPFALIGGDPSHQGYINDLNKKEISFLQQPHYLLLIDTENTTSKNPVYKIEIDGTANPDTFVKVCSDVTELNFMSGFVN